MLFKINPINYDEKYLPQVYFKFATDLVPTIIQQRLSNYSKIGHCSLLYNRKYISFCH